MKIPRIVTKYGTSYVIVLDSQSRNLLGGLEEGETIYITKNAEDDNNKQN